MPEIPKYFEPFDYNNSYYAVISKDGEFKAKK